MPAARHARINQLHKDRPSCGQFMIGSFHGIAVYRARVYSRAARRRHQRVFGGARFYEEYQIKSLVFGKYQTGPAYRSQIIDYTPNVDIDTMPVMLKTVNGIARAHADKTIVLMAAAITMLPWWPRPRMPTSWRITSLRLTRL